MYNRISTYMKLGLAIPTAVSNFFQNYNFDVFIGSL
jgi:hypothetical protein